MIISIVACGQTAEGWQNIPHDLSIGVNDAYKFGYRFNILCIFNHKSKFSKSRQETILKTKPVKLYTNCFSWVDHFPDHVLVKLRSWDGHLRDDITRLAHANTSPIIAMSLAYCLGASKIILWGVEFLNHSTFNTTNPETQLELRAYRQFIEALREKGIETYLGSKGSALEQFTPVWTSQQ